MLSMSFFQIRKLCIYLLYIYVLFTFLFPVLFINKIVFICLFFISIVILIKYYRRKICLNPIIVYVVFFYGFLISIVANNNYDLSFSLMLSPLSLFLLYVLGYFDIDLSCIIKNAGIIMAVVTIALFVVLVNFPDIYDIVVAFFKKYSGEAVGLSFRDYLSTESQSNILVFVSLPGSYHLFLPFIISFNKLAKDQKIKDAITLVVILVAVLLSGARAQILVVIIYMYVYIFIQYKKYRLALCVIALMVVISLFYSNTILFSLEEGSNFIKFMKAKSFFDSIDLEMFLFGKGLSSSYFVSFMSKELIGTELSLFDLFRYLGFFLIFVFSFTMFIPIYLHKNGLCFDFKIRLLSSFVLLLFLIYSMTNPILLNSLGFLVVLWCWNKGGFYEKC